MGGGVFMQPPGTEYKIEKYGQIGKEKKRHHPGDGALTGPPVHDDIENEEDADQVQHQRDQQHPMLDDQFGSGQVAILNL